MRFFTDAAQLWPVRLLLLAIVVGMLLAGRRTRRAVVMALLAFPLANETTDVLKAAFRQPRPFQVLDDVILRVGWSDSFGTASAHSANYAAVAFVFTYHLGWWGVPWAFMAFMTGISRIYNGVHFPYQVLLGWTVGCFAGLVIVKTWEAYLRLRQPVREEEPHEPPDAPNRVEA
jgi:undecaprenyl-diphosphatase